MPGGAGSRPAKGLDSMKMARDAYQKPNYFIKALKWLFWALVIIILYGSCAFSETIVNQVIP